MPVHSSVPGPSIYMQLHLPVSPNLRVWSICLRSSCPSVSVRLSLPVSVLSTSPPIRSSIRPSISVQLRLSRLSISGPSVHPYPSVNPSRFRPVHVSAHPSVPFPSASSSLRSVYTSVRYPDLARHPAGPRSDIKCHLTFRSGISNGIRGTPKNKHGATGLGGGRLILFASAVYRMRCCWRAQCHALWRGRRLLKWSGPPHRTGNGRHSVTKALAYAYVVNGDICG